MLRAKTNNNISLEVLWIVWVAYQQIKNQNISVPEYVFMCSDFDLAYTTGYNFKSCTFYSQVPIFTTPLFWIYFNSFISPLGFTFIVDILIIAIFTQSIFQFVEHSLANFPFSFISFFWISLFFSHFLHFHMIWPVGRLFVLHHMHFNEKNRCILYTVSNSNNADHLNMTEKILRA